MKLPRAAAALLALCGPCAQAAPPDCPTPEPGATQLEQAGVRASWRAEPGMAVSQPFALRIGLCPTRAELLKVDAHMPEHRHGMNYRVRLTPLAPGQWKADGLVWHMPGRWELVMVLRLDGQEQRLATTVVLR